jgi:hypothetical protein
MRCRAYPSGQNRQSLEQKRDVGIPRGPGGPPHLPDTLDVAEIDEPSYSVADFPMILDIALIMESGRLNAPLLRRFQLWTDVDSWADRWAEEWL